MKKALFILGMFSLLFGIWHGIETFSFLKKAIKTEATVLGYSSVHKLDRIESDCSAFSKGCAAKITYTLPDKEPTETLVSQPIFSRIKTDKITIFVDPANPQKPRIASLHVLFRNATSTVFLGLMCLFLGWLIGTSKQQKN